MANPTYFAVTPSDTTALPVPVRMIWVGVTGTVSVSGAGDGIGASGSTLTAVPAGQWILFPVPIVQINATGTTATGIVGCAHNNTAFTAT
jgi:hypothetical protein